MQTGHWLVKRDNEIVAKGLNCSFDSNLNLYEEEDDANTKTFTLSEVYQITSSNQMIVNKIATWREATGFRLSGPKDVWERRTNLMGTTLVVPVIGCDFSNS